MSNNTKTMEKEKIYVEVPKGIDTGEIIKIENKGNVINDTNKGDVKVHVNVTNDTTFIRSGLNLLFNFELTIPPTIINPIIIIQIIFFVLILCKIRKNPHQYTIIL